MLDSPPAQSEGREAGQRDGEISQGMKIQGQMRKDNSSVIKRWYLGCKVQIALSWFGKQVAVL